MFDTPDFLRSLVIGLLVGTLLHVLSACGDIAPHDNGDQGPPRDPDAGPTDTGDAGDGYVERYVHVTLESEGQGTLTVDASDPERWVYLDLDTLREVEPQDPADDTGERHFDLAFRRFHIALNGGQTGTGGVTAARVDDQALTDVTLPAEAAFETDLPDGDDEDTVPDYVISGGLDPWYAYDVETHILTPKPRVYVVRTTEDAVFRIAVERYYDQAGGSGHPTLRFAVLPTP
ncbi:MAG: HmuY family protein [Polyangiales bacterium]